MTAFASSEQLLLVAGSAALWKPPLSRQDAEVSTEEGRDGRVSLQLVCVCYGLGSFSSCVSARYQLAMLLLLLEALRVSGFVQLI